MSNRNGQDWYQGTFVPTNPSKCINQTAIQFRSSWESRFCHWLDQNPSVKKWGYEVISLPYRFEVDGRVHQYIVDFYAEIVNKNNGVDKYLIEIKPKNQGEKPTMPKRQTAKSMKNYVYEAHTYIRNQNKWNAAQNFCRQNGITFKILTKDNLF
jgi:hypothetical protein